MLMRHVESVSLRESVVMMVVKGEVVRSDVNRQIRKITVYSNH